MNNSYPSCNRGLPVEKKTILIVDDSPENLTVLYKILRDDYKVIGAGSGAEALRLVAANKPNLILLDIMMPEMSGFEVCAILKEDASLKEIPVIFITALVDETDEVRGFEVGAVDYITKPFRPSILKHRVSTHLELKSQKDLLRESDERHRSILQTAMDGIWLTDIQGNLLEVNETYCRMSGYIPEELLLMNISDLEAKEYEIETAAHIARIIDQGEGRFESLHRRKDGALFDVAVSAQYRPFNGGQFVVFLHDITERKKAKKLLLSRERYQRTLLDNFPFAVWLKDTESRFLAVNQVFATTFEVQDVYELVGKSDFDIAPHDLAEKYRADDQAVMKTLQKNVVEEEIIDQGVRKWFETYKAPVVDKDDVLLGTVGFTIDTTVRKQAEKDRQLLEQQFQQAQKLESLGVLAGGIAHDFNNILTIISGYCELIKMDPNDVLDQICQIQKAAGRAAELCRQMLAYAGKAHITHVKVNMPSLVGEMVAMLKTTIQKNVGLVSNLSGDIPVFDGDASQISQVVMNLIINASEAIGDNPGKIHVSLFKSEIKAEQGTIDHGGKLIPSGWYACLEVTDNGCGMSEETKIRLFEPFFTTKFTGRGLGMSATLGIIKAHNGALQCSSQLNHGTTFKVYLPIQANETCEPVLRNGITTTQWQGNGTILLVEDEAQIASLAKAMLKQMGFTVIEASHGKEALELYHQHASDILLVLTDMGMPVMDGYTLFRELKNINPELPIVISSGFGDTVVTMRIPSEEIAGLISKPYRFDQLRDVMKKVIA